MPALTKETLIADRTEFLKQLAATQANIRYIDGLLAFMDRTDAIPVEPEKPAGKIVVCEAKEGIVE